MPMNAVRPWPVAHAAECHALPPVAVEAASTSAAYLGQAHRLIERAHKIVNRAEPAWNDTEQYRPEALAAVAQAMTAFALATHQIEAC